MYWLLLIISWLLTGFVALFLFLARDLRGEDFDINYFSGEIYFSSIFIILFGYVSLFVVIIFIIIENDIIAKLLYKIANIGIKNKSSKETIENETNRKRD
jgi:lipid-A-disaccharide synthase-like uncharacterized protein